MHLSIIFWSALLCTIAIGSAEASQANPQGSGEKFKSYDKNEKCGQFLPNCKTGKDFCT